MLDETELDKLKVSCREDTFLRSDKSSQHLSTRPLRSRDHDQLSICRWDPFMGEDREREMPIRNGDVGRDSHRRYWRECGETRCEGKTETDTKFDVIFYDDSGAVS